MAHKLQVSAYFNCKKFLPLLQLRVGGLETTTAGTHSAEGSEVGHFPSEAPLVVHRYPVVSHRSLSSLTGLTGVCIKQK